MKVCVYGGNGYVGAKIVERLARQGLQVLAISRRGQCPAHLEKHQETKIWMKNVTWTIGDVSKPSSDHLEGSAAVITTVGSPPLPTFNQTAFELQVFMNGGANAALIEACRHGPHRVVLCSAHIPSLLQTRKFGYYVGKTLAIIKATEFYNNHVKTDPTTSVGILKPSGTRFLFLRFAGNIFLSISWFVWVFCV